ncbi:MAG TPA: acyclic terpene utilization AtuA family protein [Burkholderiaceae bacterium]|nr:acyclic terpene utilization AtuA family protein [Burkholderiaceae bacterium]
MKSVRIGAGLGFYGDSWLPIRATLERGDVKYIASDHLSELTLAILRKDLAKDPSAGYTRDLVPMLTALWPLAAPRGVRFVLNAGGLNPRGAGAALTAAFRANGWRARIAVVTGDDVLDQIDALRAGGDTLRHMDTGVEIDTVRERLVFANAYLGAGPITQALAAGADIVLTGRVADAALALGPIVHELGWPLAARTQQEWDRLALGLTVGHLLECSGQGSGGNFGSAGAWNEIPDLGHIGYPIAEVREDGVAIITKAPHTGGRVSFDTVRQQLLYEVQNPHAYFSPDVVLDMGTLRLTDLGDDRVEVQGATGKPRPAQLKIVAGYEDGWMGHAVIGFCWPDAYRKAEATVALIEQALREQKLPIEETQVEYLGLDAFLGPHADRSARDQMNEVWLRMAVRTRERHVAEAFPRQFPWLALSGPPYMGGFHGIAPASQLLGVWPALAARERIETKVDVQIEEMA